MESIRTGAPFEMEYRLKFPVFDDYRWYLGRAVAHRDESGEIVRWYATSTDIHDRKMAEAELRHADRQKDEFLGDARPRAAEPAGADHLFGRRARTPDAGRRRRAGRSR